MENIDESAAIHQVFAIYWSIFCFATHFLVQPSTTIASFIEQFHVWDRLNFLYRQIQETGKVL